MIETNSCVIFLWVYWGIVIQMEGNGSEGIFDDKLEGMLCNR